MRDIRPEIERFEISTASFADGKVGAVGMMEDERADAGLGIHHHSFREVDVDLFGVEQGPDSSLVFEVRAGRIAEAVALAAIARGEALRHGQTGPIGEAPVLPNAP